MADLVASQLERFTTGLAHHVAGQFANLDFWLAEVTHALAVLDGYRRRFDVISEGQAKWVEAHDTRVPIGGFCPMCAGRCEFYSLEKPGPPTRMFSSDRDDARRRLKDAAYYFVLRYYRMGLLTEAGVRDACAKVGTSVDPTDLRRPRAE